MTDAEYRAQLAARRQQLVQRAQRQRVVLAHDAQPLLQAVHWLEYGMGAWRALRAHPGWALAPAVLFALWRPRGALRTLPMLLWVSRLVARRIRL